MATITTANNNSALNSSRRSYVAVKDFNNTDFAKYTVTMNSQYVNVGTLTAVTTDAALAPKGRVLRENGRKLYPDANPGVTRYLVGVYDSETSLSGFIDPNSPTFTIFNSDRPNYIPVNDEVDIGAPVYTAGTIEADGAATLNGGLTIGGGQLVETVDVTAHTGNAPTLDLTLGNIFVVTAVTSAPTFSATGGVKGLVYYISVTANGAYAITAPANTAFSTLLTITGTVLITAVRTA